MILNSQKPPDYDTDERGLGRRLCDFCGDATALVYCRADSAKLCLACDREVHFTNPLFTKHTRWLLCDACDSTPASIFCSTHTSVLCQNCDWETHQFNCSLQQPAVHDRRPLEGFSGCPSVSELLGILGFDEIGKKSLLFEDDVAVADAGFAAIKENNTENVYGLSDFLVWETPSIVSFDDLIMSNDSSSGRSLQAMGVPPLPKNRNATCGQYKEEILLQLREMSKVREMSKLEPKMNDGQAAVEPLSGFQSLELEQNFEFGQQDELLNQNAAAPILGSTYEGSAFQLGNDKVEDADQDISTLIGGFIEIDHMHKAPDKDSGIVDSPGPINGSHGEQPHPPGTETLQILPRRSIRELNSQERETAISRYKEKKKTRRYDKHIRYETRKVRAESRTRIRGRFAKIDR